MYYFNGILYPVFRKIYCHLFVCCLFLISKPNHKTLLRRKVTLFFFAARMGGNTLLIGCERHPLIGFASEKQIGKSNGCIALHDYGSPECKAYIMAPFDT